MFRFCHCQACPRGGRPRNDAYYFFTRGEWSPFLGVGYQNWNFQGVSSGAYSGVSIQGGNTASVITIPVGVQLVGDSGLTLQASIALDYFLNSISELAGKIFPEAQIQLGFFF